MGTATASGEAWYIAVTDGDAADRLSRHGFEVRNQLADGDVLVVTGREGKTDRIASTSGVSAATVDVPLASPAGEGPTATPPDEVAAEGSPSRRGTATTHRSETTDEPHYDRQWDKPLIDLPAAHERTTGEGTRIALLDTGVYADHPDLDVNEDLSRVVTRETIEKRTVRDMIGHGTHVAGIATASINNDVGMAGVAPDAEVVSIRDTYDPEGGDGRYTPTLARRLAGLEYAASIDVDVVSSTGSPAGRIRSFPPAARANALAKASRRLIQQAVDSGTVVVQAAGNYFLPPEGGTNFQDGGGTMFPGSVPSALTVGATGPTDERAYYSHYGLGYLDIVAPGGGYGSFEKTFESADVDRPYPTNGVFSTTKPGTRLAENSGFPESDRYGYSLGTSMATPQAAGVAALVRSIAPDVNPYRVIQALKQSADGKKGPELGSGRLNAAAALESSVLDGARE
ncbi:S8 family serine peptidase [Halorhabdus sp. BNX81]|uniref:S8 family peptidase n=1 Tax=Halorhabdus sp. BNX81 TaxID=2980181 RepID=UPI0023DD070B|nr:S8 family serine peptidase [Halorhabdus sp. BNX81]